MKKSEMYRLAQVAVLHSSMSDEEKLEVLRMLANDEILAKYTEAKEVN